MRTQVTFDAADSHALAAFWASVPGTEVEDHPEFVDQLVADGRMLAADRITINGRSAFRTWQLDGTRRASRPGPSFKKVPEGT